MKAQNIKEFKALIERYETIELKEIKKVFEDYYPIHAKRKLTGFNSLDTCTLCLNVNGYCNKCVYKIERGCIRLNKELKESYYRLKDADTPIKFKNECRNRAKVLREYAKQQNIELSSN